MIPINKNSLTRTDLSLVLGAMVDNIVEGNTIGIQLAKEISQQIQYYNGIALRSAVDAIVCAMEVMNCNTLLMPVLIPQTLATRLEALGKTIIYYDVDIETMAPIFHDAYPIEYTDTMMSVRCNFFGGIIDYADTLPQEFLNLPSIELCWSLRKSHIIETTSDDTSDNISLHDNVSDFLVILLEKNTLLTAGGGALLAASNKVHWKSLSQYTKHSNTWISLTDLNASLAFAQFKQLHTFISRIEKIIPFFIEAIQKTKHTTLLAIRHADAIPQCFPIMVHKRTNEVVKQIRKQGIECVFPFQDSVMGVMMETAPQEQKSMLLKQYPHAVKYITNVISVPCYPLLDNEEVKKIVQVIAILL